MPMNFTVIIINVIIIISALSLGRNTLQINVTNNYVYMSFIITIVSEILSILLLLPLYQYYICISDKCNKR